MSRHERISKVLRGYAEIRVPGAEDPWPAIRESIGADAAAANPRRSRRRFRLVPGTRVGWVFAALVTLLVASTGAYATGGVMDILDGIFGETVPYIQEHDLGTPVNEKQSRDGVTVTIDRVYADSSYVAVGYVVEGVDKLDEPSHWFDTDLRIFEPGDEKSDRKFQVVDAFGQQWAPGARRPAPPKGSFAGTVVFEAPERLQAGEEHRFRARVDIFGPKGRIPQSGGYETEPYTQPFFFDLKVPVKTAPIIGVNQTVEAGGVPITLTDVVDSPAKTSAYLCFDPPEDKYDWPLVKTRFFEEGRLADAPVYHIAGGAVRDGCATYNFDRSLYAKAGTHSLTVTELSSSTSDTAGSVKGPWRFEFEVPER